MKEPRWVYPAADFAVDSTAASTPLLVAVAQVSAAVGLGAETCTLLD